MKYKVLPEEHGLSLLVFLQQKNKGLSVKNLKKAIASKACKIGGKIEIFSSRKLAQEEVVEFDLGFFKEDKLYINVIFEDRDFVVVDKSFGIVSLLEEFKKHLGDRSKDWKLVHRLDKDTSGLVLLAKNSRAEEAAKKIFSERNISKLYLAIVDGKVSGKKGIIDNYLGKVGGYQGQTLYGALPEKDGARAITHWTCLVKGKESSLILCDLKTGRTHQIRVHLSEMGHPILGDDQYRKRAFSSEYQPKRHLLHAWKLAFLHPFTHKNIQVKSPIPEDFQRALVDLDLHWNEKESL